MLGGLYRMFAPEAPQAAETSSTFAGFALIFVFGCVLTFQAYRRR